MTSVRVAPLAVDDWVPGLRERCEATLGGPFNATANVYRTLANAPLLFEAWLHLGGQLLRRSSLDPRDRELVILRTTAVSSAPYPFTQHTRIGRGAGMSDTEIDAVLVGRTDPNWASIDRLLIMAVDELFVHGTLSDGIWDELNATLSTRNVLDVIATVAFYRQAAWVLNACGTALDDGQESRLRPTAADTITTGRPPDRVRLEPLPVAAWPQALQDETLSWPRFRGRPELRGARVYATLANHPELFRSMGPMMAHLLVDNSLEDRHRELVIVRSCYRDHGRYPYRQHVRIGAEVGLSEETLAALALVDPRLDEPHDAALVAVIDELHDTNTIADDTWSAASARFTTTQLLDAIATAGFYGLISFVLNSAGTDLEAGEARLPNTIRPKGGP